VPSPVPHSGRNIPISRAVRILHGPLQERLGDSASGRMPRGAAVSVSQRCPNRSQAAARNESARCHRPNCAALSRRCRFRSNIPARGQVGMATMRHESLDDPAREIVSGVRSGGTNTSHTIVVPKAREPNGERPPVTCLQLSAPRVDRGMRRPSRSDRTDSSRCSCLSDGRRSRARAACGSRPKAPGR
jgi:hypothetical protein